MEKLVFKTGDRVFVYPYGWGTFWISNNGYEIIDWEKKDFTDRYSYCYEMISFTEYTLQGFSQEKPRELPKVGELCLVKDIGEAIWRAEYFVEVKDGVFCTNDSNGITSYWEELKRIKILD